MYSLTISVDKPISYFPLNTSSKSSTDLASSFFDFKAFTSILVSITICCIKLLPCFSNLRFNFILSHGILRCPPSNLSEGLKIAIIVL